MTENKKEQEAKNYSRRDFIKNASLLAGSAALGTAFLGGCAPGTKAVLSASDQKWDRTVDIVVVGYGPAGAFAAKTAIEGGASTLIVEKESKENSGGACAVSMGYFTKYTVDGLVESARGRRTREEAQHLLDEMNAAEKWMKDSAGLEMDDVIAKGNGQGYWKVLDKAINSINGIEILYETPAKGLISNLETHEVYGIKCQDKSGKELYIKANKAVILCTGDFIANHDLVERCLLPNGTNYVTMGPPHLTGDGFKMALEAGAAFDSLTQLNIEWYGVAYRKASEELKTGILHMLNRGCKDARIWVNFDGKRFMDEQMYLVHNKHLLQMLDYDGTLPFYKGWANLPMYVIFDSTLANSGPVGNKDNVVGWAAVKNIYNNWSTDNQVELNKGWLVSDNTLEGLVAKLAEQSGNKPINIEGLKKTISQYNDYCEQGVDRDFNRSKRTLLPLNKPPYYAAEIVPCGVYTIGGLEGGKNGETIGWNGEPIPRLYHAGNISQVCQSQVWGISGCEALGVFAARAALKLDPQSK